ncbi:SCRIB-like protein [Mya arenaria]|uniref:SCRIB-like protein n=1 Tax=Mya arenaria TaxID=6604 RepID=A0ABY7F677_MYAAR|nr:SCRIB-like protein [Mya arenaria]
MNHLENIPKILISLSSLAHLELRENMLRQLPASMSFLVKLESLDLGSNEIDELELPHTIGELRKLTNFNVDRNRLTEIPTDIGRCKKLDILSMRDNLLLRLPQELGYLKELHVLDVSGNRLEYLPITVTNLNLRALWLSENQAQPMLKFQTDFDERTGQKVLTCFLLPQQAFHTESMGGVCLQDISFVKKHEKLDARPQLDM